MSLAIGGSPPTRWRSSGRPSICTDRDGNSRAVGEGDARVHEQQAGDEGGVLHREPQRQRAAHRQAAHEHLAVRLGEVEQLVLDRGVPVLPAGPVHLLPRGAVAGQARGGDGETVLGHRRGPVGHARRGAGEAVDEHHGDGATVVADGLGTRHQWHGVIVSRGGVAVEGIEGSWPVRRSPLVTVPPTVARPCRRVRRVSSTVAATADADASRTGLAEGVRGCSTGC